MLSVVSIIWLSCFLASWQSPTALAAVKHTNVQYKQCLPGEKGPIDKIFLFRRLHLYITYKGSLLGLCFKSHILKHPSLHRRNVKSPLRWRDFGLIHDKIPQKFWHCRGCGRAKKFTLCGEGICNKSPFFTYTDREVKPGGRHLFLTKLLFVKSWLNWLKETEKDRNTSNWILSCITRLIVWSHLSSPVAPSDKSDFWWRHVILVLSFTAITFICGQLKKKIWLHFYLLWLFK